MDDTIFGLVGSEAIPLPFGLLLMVLTAMGLMIFLAVIIVRLWRSHVPAHISHKLGLFAYFAILPALVMALDTRRFCYAYYYELHVPKIYGYFNGPVEYTFKINHLINLPWELKLPLIINLAILEMALLIVWLVCKDGRLKGWLRRLETQ